MQTVAPGGEVEPAGHGMQEAWPSCGLNVPAAHGGHEVDPEDIAKWPGAQGAQGEAGEAEKCPGSQGVHL